MGIRMRKSINLGGGFKINLSKSGIGYSWGVPGYRVTRTAKGTTRRTYSIPGTGLSYVDESGRNRNRTPNSGNSVRNVPEPLQPQEQVRNIESAGIDSFKAAEIGNITSAIEKTIRLNKWSTVLIVCAILIPAYPLLVVLPILGIILKIIAHKSGAVQLEYTLDDEKEDEYNRRIGAWQILAEGDKEWQVIQEAQVLNQKVNAGAGRNVKRIVCKIDKATPFYINTNVDTIQIKLNKELLIFLPDKVFIIRKSKVGLINYEDVSIRISQTRFIESAPVPKDAVVVGSTWQYVNKNGTPDRRYRNNRQLPICQYGVVYLTSGTGLNVEMQFSNVNKTQDFEELIR
ncbi:hypothetical protein SDC9_59826 [bioreactor metagenome]|uniref:DUF4236 domain-containing protein n=1 Tax=bioreactor metagenome TaxID=1076179 RepID=A0A644XBG9_9ZZZZ